MRPLPRMIAAAAALGLAMAPALAADKAPLQKPVELHGGWMHEAVAGQTIEAYVTIENKGDKPDTLMFVTGPEVNHVDIDRSDPTPDGSDHTTNLDKLDVPAGGTLSLGPGRIHLVLSGLTESLERGKNMLLIFHFKNAGDVSAFFVVKRLPGSDGPAPDSHDGSTET